MKQRTPHTLRSMLLRAGLAVAAGAVFVASAPAGATVVIIEDVPTMSKKADVVVRAAIGDQTVKQDAKGRIITLTQIEVLESFKGAEKGDILTIYQVGGELNGKRMRIAGAHAHQPGEEMVLFAVKYKDMLVSYGVGVGKFRVERDADDIRVVEDLHDVVGAVPSKKGMKLEHPKPRRYVSLDALRDQIRVGLGEIEADEARTPVLRRLTPKLDAPLKVHPRHLKAAEKASATTAPHQH